MGRPSAASCVDDDGVRQASGLIQEMASNEDIMSIRERQLCVIFALDVFCRAYKDVQTLPPRQTLQVNATPLLGTASLLSSTCSLQQAATSKKTCFRPLPVRHILFCNAVGSNKATADNRLQRIT